MMAVITHDITVKIVVVEEDMVSDIYNFCYFAYCSMFHLCVSFFV